VTVCPADIVKSRHSCQTASAAETTTSSDDIGGDCGVFPFHRVAVTGGSPQAMALATTLAARNTETLLIEDDQYDARRSVDWLERSGRADCLSVVVGCDLAATADLVIEASGTELSARKSLLATLAQAAPDAVLVSVGAGASLAELKAVLPLNHPLALVDLVGPPPDFALIEVLVGSDPRVLPVASRLGLTAVQGPAFISTHLIAALEDEVEALIFEGSTPWELDEAALACGFTLGPCAAQDQRGLDGTRTRHRAQGHSLPVVDRMVAEGRLGRKTGVGWYRYPGNGGQVIDPLIEDLAREEAYFAKQTPRLIPDEEIQRRLVGRLDKIAQELRTEISVIRQIATISCHYPTIRTGSSASEKIRGIS